MRACSAAHMRATAISRHPASNSSARRASIQVAMVCRLTATMRSRRPHVCPTGTGPTQRAGDVTVAMARPPSSPTLTRHTQSGRRCSPLLSQEHAIPAARLGARTVYSAMKCSCASSPAMEPLHGSRMPPSGFRSASQQSRTARKACVMAWQGCAACVQSATLTHPNPGATASRVEAARAHTRAMQPQQCQVLPVRQYTRPTVKAADPVAFNTQAVDRNDKVRRDRW